MAKYKIKIEHTSQALNGEVLLIDAPIGTELFTWQYWSSPDPIPGGNYVEIGQDLEHTNHNAYLLFRQAYNLQGTYTVVKGVEFFTIEGDFVVEPVIGGAIAGVTITIEESEEPITFGAMDFVEADTNKCDRVDLDITASRDFIKLLQPYEETFAATSTKTVKNLDRGRFYNIEIETADGVTNLTTVQTPSFLNSGLIEVVLVNNTAIINDYTTGLTLEYSLNNITWQSNNAFTNLAAGNYTVYVRDHLGCSTQTNFTILEGDDGEQEIIADYFAWSKANPIRMALRETIDDSTVFANEENTLSCESAVRTIHAHKQYWRSTDTIDFQLKSNIADTVVKTTDDNTIVPLIQKSNNMGIKESMDCKVIDLGSNRYGIYFVTGKRYDYDSGADLNNDYVLNGQMPNFGKVNQRITINNINYTVEEVTFNQDLQYYQMIITSENLNGITDTIVKAIYNIFDYEIFEGSIVVNGRTSFDVAVYLNGVEHMRSETNYVNDSLEWLYHLKWAMDYNTDLFFATGIMPSNRMLMEPPKASVKNEGEGYETDSDSKLIDTKNYEVDILKFLPVPKAVAKNLILWLSHTVVQCNGINYRKEGIEMEQQGDSNLYVVTATMIIRDSGLNENRIGTANVEIPELLETDSNDYIKI